MKRSTDELSKEEIEDIRKRYWFSDDYVDDIAERFNVHPKNVWNIAGPLEIKCNFCGTLRIQKQRTSRILTFEELCDKCIALREVRGYTDFVFETIEKTKENLKNMESRLEECHEVLNCLRDSPPEEKEVNKILLKIQDASGRWLAFNIRRAAPEKMNINDFRH